MLEIRLFGTFDISCDGQPLTLSSRVAQSLFAYLLLNAGTAHRREKLAGMFWPEATEAKARAYLRHELWRIRKTLWSKSKSNYLIADTLSVCFNASSPYWLDVGALENVGETASIEELMGGLALYQGEFLPGLYDEWILLEREHLVAFYEQKLARLLKSLESENRWNEILDWAERWISHGQQPEAAYRALMSAYAALGDKTKVAETYQRCVQALAERGLEPSQETRALALRRTHPRSVPKPLTSFIGRHKERQKVANLLSKSRLVTLTGSGGVGKTRLAIQVVEDVPELFPDGVWFVDLAPLSDPALLPNTVAEALSLRLIGGSNPSITDLIVGYLGPRRTLIIFDNGEHLLDACARLVDSLLTACKGLHILATSRELLRVAGEIPYRVSSLKLPRLDGESTIEALTKIESVRLFTERAVLISQSFVLDAQTAPMIAQICRRLDGIPLAIELAAARVNMLTVEQILRRLDDRFRLLTRGSRVALPHHETLHTAMDWSYGLLSEQECILFRRLAVFRGGWTLEAAEAVCREGIQQNMAELLDRLVERSLVFLELSSAHNEMRFEMLETIQQFAFEKLLESGEENIIRQWHLAYFRQLVEQAEPEIRGHNQVVWLNRLENELDNMRAVLEWAQNRDVESCLRLASALWRFWDMRGYADEGLGWMTRMFSQREVLPADLYARALARASQVASNNGYFTQAEAFASEAHALAKELNDKPSLARALLIMSTLELVRFREESGLDYLEKSLDLSQEIGDHGMVASIFFNFANHARNHDLSSTISFMEQGLHKARLSGDKRLISHGLQQLSLYSLVTGNTEHAHNLAKEALSLIQDIDDKANTLACHWLFSSIALFCEDYSAAEEHALKAQKMARWQNDGQSMSISLKYLSLVSWAKGSVSRFREQTQEALSSAQERSDQFLVIELLVRLGEAFRLEGNLIQARDSYRTALAVLVKANLRTGYCICLEGIAALAIMEGQAERGIQLLGAWEKLREITFVVDNTFAVDNYPFLLRQRQALIALARTQLPEAALVAAWQAGRAMSPEQMLDSMIESIR